MDADAGGFDVVLTGRAAVDGAGALNVDAELVLAKAGGDVGMGFGEDVGVDAQGDASALLRLAARSARRSSSASLSTLKSRIPALEGEVDSRPVCRLRRRRRARRRLCCMARRVRARRRRRCRSLLRGGEELENRERGVGFDGVADEMFLFGECFGEEAETVADVVGGVDVEGCPVFFGERLERNFATGERGVTAGRDEGSNREQAASGLKRFDSRLIYAVNSAKSLRVVSDDRYLFQAGRSNQRLVKSSKWDG